MVLMRSFLKRILGRAGPDDADSVAANPSADLADQLQKLARAQARAAMRLEETERKLEAGFDDLRGEVRALSRQGGSGAPAAADLAWDPLLDALDLLGEAERHAATDAPQFASGLAGIRSRIEAFVHQSGLTRLVAEGVPTDGRLFRVVGTAPRADLPEGSIVRVVRAAVRRGERLIREGEVLVSVAPGQEVSS